MGSLRRSTGKSSPELNQNGLPEDIAMPLFSKLSIKDLVRFKSVSKHWGRMISDPESAKMHIKVSGETHMLLFLKLRPTREARIASLNPGATAWESIPLPSRIGSEVKILGCHDGLLCISGEAGEILLYNPWTRECRDIELPAGCRRRNYLAGIGYDGHSRDYKVVVVLFESNVSRENNIVVVFSLRENSWREAKGVRGFPYSLGCNDTHRVPVNGTIHWLVKDLNRSRVIVSFDIVTEEIKEIPLPNLGGYVVIVCEPNCRIDLGVLRGRLALMLHNQYDLECSFYFQVWVMEEHGVGSSWIRQHMRLQSLCSNSLVRRVSCRETPVLLFKDGQVWLVDARDASSGSDDTGRWTDTPIGFRNTLVAFAPSSVSPYHGLC